MPFFRCDNPPEEVASPPANSASSGWRPIYAANISEGPRDGGGGAGSLSDLQFIDSYRVPFQFRGHVSRHLGGGIFYEASDGVTLTDVDGNRLYDLAGSYGVNLLGYDVYKQCIAEAVDTVGRSGRCSASTIRSCCAMSSG